VGLGTAKLQRQGGWATSPILWQGIAQQVDRWPIGVLEMTERKATEFTPELALSMWLRALGSEPRRSKCALGSDTRVDGSALVDLRFLCEQNELVEVWRDDER
jgi:hypothetical protein